MCLSFNPEQLKLEAFRLPKPQKNLHVVYLPNFYQNSLPAGELVLSRQSKFFVAKLRVILVIWRFSELQLAART